MTGLTGLETDASERLRVLTVNVGSSSVKLSVLDGDTPIQSVSIERNPSREDASRNHTSGRSDVDDGEIMDFLSSLDSSGEAARASRGPNPWGIDACGHRVVHGGLDFDGPAVIDDKVRAKIEELASLAPLHQGASLEGMELTSRILPGTPEVACFDTAFHSAMPPCASTYALPSRWRERWPLRRFGFHGLSHSWAAARASKLAGFGESSARVVTCHLGAGSSLAAVRDGKSVDTTMGFTPLEGIVMATRSGSVDPGLLIWLQEHGGVPLDRIAHALEHESGMLGLFGSGDIRDALAAESNGDSRAGLAMEIYIHRLRAAIASMAAAMGGTDVLAFTGGIGEGSPAVRSRACSGLEFIGVKLDESANLGAYRDSDIGDPSSGVRVYVIESREDIQIARQTRAALGFR